MQIFEEMATANDKLIKNLENQLDRLVEQLKDLEECKNDISEEEFNSMKDETVDQIKEFSDALDRMQKGDVSLNSDFSRMKLAIRNAIATSFNTVQMIKMFGAQNADEIEKQLLQLDEELRLKKLTKEEFEAKKIGFLTKLQAQGRAISAEDKKFMDTVRDNELNYLEQVDED